VLLAVEPAVATVLFVTESTMTARGTTSVSRSDCAISSTFDMTLKNTSQSHSDLNKKEGALRRKYKALQNDYFVFDLRFAESRGLTLCATGLAAELTLSY
jgi:hypothetical protein